MKMNENYACFLIKHNRSSPRVRSEAARPANKGITFPDVGVSLTR